MALLYLWCCSSLGKPLFEDDAALRVVLTLPVDQIQAQRKQEPPLYLPAQLAVAETDDGATRLPVKVRARGNYRRRNCANPPLRLNFKKSEVKGTLFSGQDKLKLVRPCDNSAAAERLVMLEYLVYAGYAAITEESFRVRPLRLSYVDSNGKRKPHTAFAFVIEDQGDMAKRNDRIILDSPTITPGELDPLSAARVDLFQFMVGNNDYSLLTGQKGEICCHNIRLLAPTESAGVTPVPYDFDFSGMVDAPYALPPRQAKTSSVRQRYFRGLCRTPEVWETTIALFNERREGVYASYGALQQLPDRSRKRSLDYLDQFYDRINDPTAFQRWVVGRCR